ncbi:MAG: DUF429 domain-containing protein [Candidatus Binataceae bacterium]
MREIETEPGASLARLFTRDVPELTRGSVALIDSPRLPRDLDLAVAMRARRTCVPSSRLLDARLRELLKTHAAAGGRAVALSLFPTPQVDYFARCARSASCKPHLVAIARELLGPFVSSATRATAPALSGGAIFTRFMLAGFVCYPALASGGVEPFESYPTLVFKLWSADGTVPAKHRGHDALDARRAILERLRQVVGVRSPLAVSTFDQADAAVLALAAAAASKAHSLVVLAHPAEGRFAVPLESSRRVPQA